MKEEDKYELIDAFLSGTLPESHEFFAQLNSDHSLAEEVELQKLVRRAVIDERLREVSKEIETLREPVNSGHRARYIGGGALLLLCSLSAIVFFLSKNEKTLPVNSPKPKEIRQNIVPLIQDSGKNISTSTPAPRITDNAMPVKDAENKFPQVQITPPSQEKAISSGNTIPAPDKVVPTSAAQTFVPEKQSETPPFSVCDTTHISADITKTEPCAKTSTGTVQVSRVRGGTGPYEYSIDGGKNFHHSEIFDQLPQGNYQILVRDRNNCSAVIAKNLLLTEKHCQEINSFVFDPLRETWEIPADKTKGGKIIIHDKSGHIVYSKVFAAQEQLNWEGTSENGETLKPGYYIYMIEHTDGSVRQGSVTLSY